MSACTLKETLEPLHLLQHPFYQAWMKGELSQETLRDYAAQYYTHVDAFPRYLSAVHSLCEDAEIRREILQNLNDEEGLTHGDPHPELWLRFAEGLGSSRAQVKSAEPREGIRHVVRTFFDLARSSLAEGLGAIYAYESQVPEIATSKIEGLQTRYGVTDQRTLEFFEVHRQADVHHRAALEKLIDSLPETEKVSAHQAARRAAQALWDFLSDVQGHAGIPAPLAA